MRHTYVDHPTKCYIDYYSNQAGGGESLPYFSGTRYQRGHGLGSLFKNVLKTVVLPNVGRVLKREVPKRLISFGSGVLDDVTRGKNLSESIKSRGIDQLKQAASDIIAPVLNNSSSRPPGIPENYKNNKKKVSVRRLNQRKHVKRDIFG